MKFETATSTLTASDESAGHGVGHAHDTRQRRTDRMKQRARVKWGITARWRRGRVIFSTSCMLARFENRVPAKIGYQFLGT